ncbi:MAG: VWA domain-containing protein [Candidatus Omnitrophica bacterium]|nr:VWA domain-containing protein [Candidatus Omnitrophota bacterium]MDD4013101.1 VWA domain-containing protein [Candidatus Omnitrophota bacterium]
MKFGEAGATWLFWLVPIVFFLLIRAGHRRKSAMAAFAGKGLDEITRAYDPVRKKAKDAVVVIAVILIAVSLLRPQWGFKWQEVKRQGLDILIALDTSNSMLAEDIRPSRLERSKLDIKDFVKKLKGDRVGLIAFSGTAFLQCPLTSDYGGFLLTLEDVDVDTIPVGGTSISRAVDLALRSYEGGKNEHKVLIIITDGEDLEGGLDEVIERARAEKVMISCVGIGTEEGELIPLKGEEGKKGFLKDREGNVVKTRLDEATMQKLALATGGVYVRSRGAESGLDIIYDRRLSNIEKKDLESKMEKNWTERFQLPLALAFFLLLLEPLMGERKRET